MIKFIVIVIFAILASTFILFAYLMFRLAWIGNSLNILRSIIEDYMRSHTSIEELESINFNKIFTDVDDVISQFWNWSKWSLLKDENLKRKLKAHEKKIKRGRKNDTTI